METIKEIWENFTDEGVNGVVLKGVSVVITYFIGIFILRLTGKKSVAQLTLPQVLFVFVISSVLGTYLAKPKEILMSLFVSIIILLIVMLTERLQVKFNKVERLLVGEANVVVRDGVILKDIVKKNKLTVDQIESQARIIGVPSLAFCKTVTIEPNGQIAIEVMEDYEPVKKIDFDNAINQILKAIGESEIKPRNKENVGNIFEEIITQDNKQTKSNSTE